MIKYKKFPLIVCFCFLLLATAQANISGINILSEEHYMYGYIGGAGEIEFTQEVPFAATIVSGGNQASGSSWGIGDAFMTSASATAEETIDPFTLVIASASTNVEFSPSSDSLSFAGSAYVAEPTDGGWSSSIRLTDLSTDDELIMVDPYQHNSELLVFSVNPDHVYRLTLDAYADTSGWFYQSAGAEIIELVSEPTVIPSPNAMCLGGFGLMLLIWWRKQTRLNW